MTGWLWHARRNRPCPFPRGPSRPAGGGEDRSPTAALVVANHTSPGDPMLLWSGHADRPEQIRPIAFLMAKELYDVPKLRWFYDALDTIPVARAGRDTAAVKTALKRLKGGGLVGIFPEGGINHDPDALRPAVPGAAFLALATDAPVFPVGIRGAPRGKNLYTSLLKPTWAELHYGDPVDLSDLRGKKKSPEVLAEATERIMRRVADLSGFAYGGLEGGADADDDANKIAADPDRRRPGRHRQPRRRRDAISLGRSGPRRGRHGREQPVDQARGEFVDAGDRLLRLGQEQPAVLLDQVRVADPHRRVRGEQRDPRLAPRRSPGRRARPAPPRPAGTPGSAPHSRGRGDCGTNTGTRRRGGRPSISTRSSPPSGGPAGPPRAAGAKNAGGVHVRPPSREYAAPGWPATVR